MSQVYKHIIEVTVLSETKTPSWETLADIAENIDTGDEIGTWRLASSKPVPAKQLTKELEAVGNDGSFFDNLDDED